ncbi:hypothetical protein Tco_1409789 [Tanacetum coccineum]
MKTKHALKGVSKLKAIKRNEGGGEGGDAWRLRRGVTVERWGAWRWYGEGGCSDDDDIDGNGSVVGWPKQPLPPTRNSDEGGVPNRRAADGVKLLLDTTASPPLPKLMLSTTHRQWWTDAYANALTAIELMGLP